MKAPGNRIYWEILFEAFSRHIYLQKQNSLIFLVKSSTGRTQNDCLSYRSIRLISPSDVIVSPQRDVDSKTASPGVVRNVTWYIVFNRGLDVLLHEETSFNDNVEQIVLSTNFPLIRAIQDSADFWHTSIVVGSDICKSLAHEQNLQRKWTKW